MAAVFLAVASGSAEAKPYRLKKIIIINETGAGGYAYTDQIGFTTSYINTYLGPKYGFHCSIPVNQAAIDSLFQDDSLDTYDVVVFNGGSRIGGAGAVGDSGAQHAFQRWLKHGGGLVGIRGLMDHNDTWPWLRDSVLSGSKFTVHSDWGSDPNAKAQWDTVKVNGEVNSLKPEYDSLRACYPPLHHAFIYPDRWYSFSVNPRPYVDVLLAIDEGTYAVPTGGAMGLDHPVAWAYHLPPDSAGNSGRFLYSQRGFETGAWDGTSANHAPATVAAGADSVNGVVYSDTSHDLMTKGFLWQSIRWAAGLTQDTVSGPSIVIQPTDIRKGGYARERSGVFTVLVTGVEGPVAVELFDLLGQGVARQSGDGSGRFFFSNLKSGTYLIRIKAKNRTYTNRAVFQ